MTFSTIISQSYVYILLISGIISFSWAYDRLIHKAKEESKLLAKISGVAAIIIFSTLFLMILANVQFHWLTFLLYFLLAVLMLAKPLKEFPFALSLTLLIITLLLTIYLFLRKNYTFLKIIPLYVVMIVILLIAIVFFVATFFLESTVDFFLGVFSWSPNIITLSIICLVQALLIIITGSDKGIAYFFT